jgi:hypothetical protein
VTVAVPRLVDPVEEDPAVRKWLARLPDSRLIYLGQIKRFMKWLRSQDTTLPGSRECRPSDLLAWQDRAETKEQRYAILDLLETYVNTQPAKAFKSRQLAYSAVRSFFAHNRSELPSDPHFRVHGEKPPTVGKLTVEDVCRVVGAAKPRDRSTIMVKWMAFLDNKGLEYTGTVLADHVVAELRAGKSLVVLDMPGRKRDENQRPFYTIFGKDAVTELVNYFENDRKGGWPKKGQPLWYDQYGLPLSRTGFAESFMALDRRIGLVPRKVGDVSTRYGYNTHEMRDAARTLLHVTARAKGFDLDCAEFFMGHTSKLDPLKYDKFFSDHEYMIQQYRIAEPYLNILSVSAAEQENAKEMESLREEVRQLKGQFETFAKAKYAESPNAKVQRF